MMLEWSSVLPLGLGAFFCLVSAVGLLRMPDLFTRMHAASVMDTLGAGFSLLGLALLSGASMVSAKLAILALLIFFSSPAVSHALAKAALTRSPAIQEESEEAAWKP